MYKLHDIDFNTQTENLYSIIANYSYELYDEIIHSSVADIQSISTVQYHDWSCRSFVWYVVIPFNLQACCLTVRLIKYYYGRYGAVNRTLSTVVLIMQSSIDLLRSNGMPLQIRIQYTVQYMYTVSVAQMCIKYVRGTLTNESVACNILIYCTYSRPFRLDI